MRGKMPVFYALVAVLALALGAWLARSLVPASTPASRSSAPAGWYLEDLDGRARSLAEWGAPVLLVNAWATWCAPCREEIPLLSRLRAEYRERGLEIIGAAVDEPAAVRGYREQLPIPYPLLVVRGDATGWLRDLGSASGALPFSVLQDRHGEVLATKTGPYSEAELRRLLDQHLPR